MAHHRKRPQVWCMGCNAQLPATNPFHVKISMPGKTPAYIGFCEDCAANIHAQILEYLPSLETVHVICLIRRGMDNVIPPTPMNGERNINHIRTHMGLQDPWEGYP